MHEWDSWMHGMEDGSDADKRMQGREAAEEGQIDGTGCRWIAYHSPMQLFNWARLVAPFAIDIGRVAWRHAVRPPATLAAVEHSASASTALTSVSAPSTGSLA